MLLALRKEPVGAGDPATLSRFPTLPEPARLPRRPVALPAASPREPAPPPAAEQRTLTIAIAGLPTDLPPTAGVGLFDDAMLQIGWLPLTGATTAGGALIVEGHVTKAPVHVHVATSERAARHGYWYRQVVPADRGDSAVALTVLVQSVVVHLAGIEPHLAKALRLRRIADDQWQPGSAGDRLPAIGADGDLHLSLGAGEYELAPWLDGPWQPLRLVVPGPAEATAWFGN